MPSLIYDLLCDVYCREGIYSWLEVEFSLLVKQLPSGFLPSIWGRYWLQSGTAFLSPSYFSMVWGVGRVVPKDSNLKNRTRHWINFPCNFYFSKCTQLVPLIIGSGWVYMLLAPQASIQWLEVWGICRIHRSVQKMGSNCKCASAFCWLKACSRVARLVVHGCAGLIL